ncbi:MAG TPA: Calx-beta domain-containing protein [Pyrinomonadaceae bacterium]|nr:Calx-beta domain-containing protein [Pyrinomonadaceae bacterium]
MLKLSWTLTLLGLLTLLLPAGANAVPLTYNLSGVTFSDSATASGSFQYDAVTNAYSNVNIITTGGSRSGATYHSVSGGFAPDSSGILLVTMAGAGQTGLPGLALFFSPVLNGAGGMSTLTGEESDCVDPECTMPSGTMRTITAGTVSAGAAATPMTWYLTGFTFADGATATGSFVFDAGTHSFSSVNIATTTATRTGATYSTLSTGLIPDATGALFDTSAAPNQTGLPGFSMLFSSPLTGAGGTTTVTGKEADCADPGCSTPTGTMRLITAGTVTTNPADMTITKTHMGNFRQGDIGDTYTLTVSNSGGVATSGMVSVSDAVPSGLTAIGISGTNWSCIQPAGPCTRSDAKAAGGSYEPITLTVNVAGNAPSSVTNIATVSGGGEINTSNDTANDPTTINPSPDLTIGKTHVGNFNQGQTGATYTITVTNSGNGPTSGTVSVSDTVPSGLTAIGISGTNWSCIQPAGPCTRSDAKAAGGSYEPITLTVNVAGNAPSSVTNFATVSGGGEANTSNDTANDPTTINPTTVQFSAGSYSVGEGDLRVNINVTRSGNTFSAATVNFATIDDAGLQNCNVFNGIASPRCDYETVVGTLQFAAGETSKSFSVAIVDDSYAEGNETFRVSLTNPSGASLGAPNIATVTITDNDTINGPNPIDNTNFFVRQLYLDLLMREPDSPGFAAWVSTINNCSTDHPGHPELCDRVHVAQSFFQSQEFQQRGYFVYRFYNVAFGRKPDYAEFVPDFASISGFLTDADLEAAKLQFIANFMARPAFAGQYNSLTNQNYVDALINTAQVNLSNRQALIDGLNNATLTRAQVLRQVVESNEVATKYFNQAFVVMEYFGYLRRQPDSLYVNWIQFLDSGADPRVMVSGFVNSTEYRQRFGPP